MNSIAESTVEHANGDASGVRPELKKIFADTFEYTGELHFELSNTDLEKWDSLRHVALVAALEQSFGVSLSMDEMLEVTSVAGIHAVLDRHGV